MNYYRTVVVDEPGRLGLPKECGGPETGSRNVGACTVLERTVLRRRKLGTKHKECGY